MGVVREGCPRPGGTGLSGPCHLVVVAKGLTDGQRTWIRKDLRPASKMVEALGQEGREEGKREQTLAFARHGLTLGESVEYVVGLSEQSLDTVQKLRAAQTGAWKTLLLGSLGMLAGTASRAVRCRSDMGGLGDC
ncbi:MAG: hypothetical protein M1600_06115 [Firmicutes bacterium]|nr:hypothetical protein [Bacillota bacterium]